MKRLLAVMLLGCLVVAGCWPFMPSTRTDSGEASGTLRSWEYDQDTGKWLGVEKKMSVKGPSGKTSQEGGAQAIKTGALKFKMDGMEAEGPKFGITAEGWASSFSTPAAILSIFGGLFLVGAVVYWWFLRNTRVALMIGGFGIGLLGCALVFEEYPWVILILFLGAVGYGAWSIYESARKKKVEAEKEQVDETLQVVARAVEEMDPSVASVVKAKISELAGKFKQEVKDVITKAKQAAGI